MAYATNATKPQSFISPNFGHLNMYLVVSSPHSFYLDISLCTDFLRFLDFLSR